MVRHLVFARARVIALLLSVLLLPIPFVPVNGEVARIKVALFVDEGSHPTEFIKNFQASTDQSMTYAEVDGDDIRNGALDGFDAILVPGGSAAKEAHSMGPVARDAVRQFVEQGGIYMGVCAGAYLASSQSARDLGFLPLTTADSDHWYRVDDATPVDVELTPLGMDIFGIKKSTVQILYQNGPIFAPPADSAHVTYTPLGFFRSEVVAKGGERGVMRGAPAMVLSRCGRGMVMAISPHPEKTPGFRQVELHALRWMYDHRSPGIASMSASNARKVVATTQPISSAVTKPSPTTEPTGSSSGNPNVGEQALKLAESIFDKASVVRYVHRDVKAADQVETDDDGTVESLTDCSGFISYIVHAVAPRHYRAVRSREPGWPYPQAKVWATFFDTLDTTEPRDGWLRINSWKELRPGDIIAWKEGDAASTNTGHVTMVAGRPGSLQEEAGVRFVQIPVIDSSSVYHFAPEQLPPKAYQKHRNGLGIGGIRIILSETGAPIGYWEGTYWGEGEKPVKGPTLSNMVRFGRMVSLEQSDH